MSKGPENTFIAGLRKYIPPNIYVMKNNNLYNSGIPDLWLSGPKGDLWLEVKFIVLPKRGETTITIDLSELQKTWIRSRSAEGRTLGVVVGSKEGGVWFPDLAWESPLKAAEYSSRLQTRAELAATIVGLVH
jgi:hypothetical protein